MIKRGDFKGVIKAFSGALGGAITRGTYIQGDQIGFATSLSQAVEEDSKLLVKMVAVLLEWHLWEWG